MAVDPWTREEDEFLVKTVSTNSIQVIANALGRSFSSVYGRAVKLGLVIKSNIKKKSIAHPGYGPMTKRDSPTYAKFRKAVLKRDKRTCQMPGCGSKKKLQVHHIFRYEDNYELREVTSNGITLCWDCHHKVTGKEEIYAPLFLQIVSKNNNK